MKKAFKVLIGCLLSASFFVACNQEVEKKETKPTVKKKVVKKVWKQEEMESSELAVLMRDMWDSTMVRKKQSMSGDNVNAYADLFNELHTAEATKVKDNVELFNSFADVFQENMKQVDAAAPGPPQREAFNNLVSTCVGCHQNYCQGPIPKIKQLYIKDEASN